VPRSQIRSDLLVSKVDEIIDDRGSDLSEKEEVIPPK
jgi:hypothetical protein